jgi:hypothetical protein
LFNSIAVKLNFSEGKFSYFSTRRIFVSETSLQLNS